MAELSAVWGGRYSFNVLTFWVIPVTLFLLYEFILLLLVNMWSLLSSCLGRRRIGSSSRIWEKHETTPFQWVRRKLNEFTKKCLPLLWIHQSKATKYQTGLDGIECKSFWVGCLNADSNLVSSSVRVLNNELECGLGQSKLNQLFNSSSGESGFKCVLWDLCQCSTITYTLLVK